MGTRNMTPSGYPVVSWADTLDLQRSALRWDIKRTMKSLCKKLEEIGEECFVVTVNVYNGWVGHLGSVRGDEYIDQKSHILYDFLSFCAESMDKEVIQEDGSVEGDTDPPLFPTLDNNCEGSNDTLIRLSRPAQGQNYPDDDDREPISVEMPPRYKDLKVPSNPVDMALNKIIFVPVNPAVPPMHSLLGQHQATAKVPEPVSGAMQAHSKQPSDSAKTPEVTEKRSKRKRKQTFKKRQDEDMDSNDSDYQVERMLAYDTAAVAQSTRRLRSSSSSRKCDLITSVEKDCTESIIDDANDNNIDEELDEYSETESTESFEEDDENDEDWVLRKSKKQLKVQKRQEIKSVKRGRGRPRSQHKRLQSVEALNKNDSEVDDSEMGDKHIEDFHIEPLSDMKFVISKGSNEDNKEREVNEEEINLHSAGRGSQKEDLNAGDSKTLDGVSDSEETKPESKLYEKKTNISLSGHGDTNVLKRGRRKSFSSRKKVD